MATRTARRKTVEKVERYSDLSENLFLKYYNKYKYQINNAKDLSENTPESLKLLKIMKINIGEGNMKDLFASLALFHNFEKYGKTDFYIKDDSLYEFLLNTDLKTVKIEDEVIYNNITEFTNLEETKDDIYVFNFIIHSKKLKHSIACQIRLYEDPDGNKAQGLTFAFDKYTKNWDLYSDKWSHEDNLKSQKAIISNIENGKNEDYSTLKNYNMLKIALNFLHYIHAFGEFVKEGAPDDAIFFNKNKTNFCIEKNPVVERITNEFSKHYMSPHLRRGHFRYLDNQYYKNKRGQTVYVKPTFIKGTAKTLIGNKINGTVN